MSAPDARIARKEAAPRGVLLRACAAVALLLTPALAAPAAALAATPAGVVIDNQAQLTFTDAQGERSLTSNRVSLGVGEVLDVEVEVVTPQREVVAGANGQTLTFRIRNRGNGVQAFDLSLEDETQGGDEFDPSGCVTIVDQNLDGVPEVSVDPVALVTPVLQPGQSVDVWASCAIPASAPAGGRGHIRITAFPTAMRGMTDEQMATAGPGGTPLVFGRSLRSRGSVGAVVSPNATYWIADPKPPAQPRAQLIKSQSVRDVMGGGRAVAGSIITYSLEARFDAGMSARKVHITDTIPDGATYVPGSLTLDGAPLADAGRFAAGAIDVALGDASSNSRTVTFQVRINPTGSSS